MTTDHDEIKTAHRYSRDGGDYCIRCGHCQQVIGIEGDDPSEIRGEQYRHRRCGGWTQVSFGAHFVKELAP